VFGLFQAKRAIRQIEEAVLVEGNFDVVSLHARGIENVIAPLGTAFTLEQAQLIKRFTPTVTLLFDGDAAGQKAIKAAREPCFKAGLMAKAATLPDGADPDDLVRTRGVDAMRAVIKASKGLLEFMIESILDVSYVRGDASERQARAREINALLNSEDDPTVRAMARRYADEVARRLGLVNDKLVDSQMGMIDRTTFDALSRSVEQALAPRNDPRERAPKVDRDHLAEAVLGCLIDFPSLLEDPDVAARLDFLEGDAVFVVSALQQAIASEADDDAVSLDADKVLALVPASFHAFARHRLAAPVHLEPDTARSELLANAEKLKRRVYSRENAAVEREAARAEAMGSDEEALALLIEATRRAKSRRSPS
jgi:DNA primase